MKSKLIVVTGGARSGKSLFAEEYLASCSGRKAYVATAQILDEEMKERVAEHRRRRPEDWQTLEISSGLSAAFPAVLELRHIPKTHGLLQEDKPPVPGRRRQGQPICRRAGRRGVLDRLRHSRRDHAAESVHSAGRLPMKSFFIALQFLSRIHVVTQTVWTEADFGRSVIFFPLVGTVIGAVLCLAYAGISLWFSQPYTAVLLVLCWLFVTGGLHADGLMDTADGLFSEEELRLVFVPSVQRFCSSPLGRRMALSSDVRREYPFSVLLPGGGYLPALEEGERILVQGVVDCLFWQDGQWVLVDYKTDRLPDEEAFRRRYAVQLALYCQAASQILGAPVGSAYIYSFYLDREIAFSF